MADAFDQLDGKKKSIGGGGDYAEWWNEDNFDIEEGDKLVGICVEKHAYTDPGGEDHPIATIISIGGQSMLGEGVEASTPTRVGIEEFAEDLELGELALIEYEGLVDTNTGREMHAYAASKLSQEEWRDMDDAEDIQETWESSAHFHETHVEGN